MKELKLDLTTDKYKRDGNEVTQELSNNVKKSKILFYLSSICIVLTLGLIITHILNASIGVIATLYFLFMIGILLPKINGFNKDALSIIENNLEEVENKVLAVFPLDNTHKEKEWMIFVQTAENEYVELEVPCDVGNALKEEDIVSVKYTIYNKIVMELKKIDK